MTTTNNISTESTSLSRNSIEPSKWSEEQKRAYLLQINERENPAELPRLQQLFEQGHNADEVAQLCDEHGHLKYKNLKDPNALINRFEFVEAEHPNIDPATGRRKNALDHGYFFPTITLIQQTRKLAEETLKDQEIITQQPELITADDYRAYFAKFHPNTLKEIIRNMKCIEITQGCNGACKKECYLGPEGPAKRHMPFEIVTWLIDQAVEIHPEILGNSSDEFKKERMPILFYASDLADYEYEGKTSADIFRYVRKKYGIELSKSISYSLAKTTIEWIYQVAIVDNITINRISRLKPGIKNEKERLREKLEERAAKDGRMISGGQWNRINWAMNQGIKGHLNINAGPNMPETLEEKDMSTEIYHCFHGTVCRAGKGFVGNIMRPTTRLYKKQLQETPLNPENKTSISIPQFHEIHETIIPFVRNLEPVVSRPLFTVMNANGETLHRDEMTIGEKRLKQLGRIKHIHQKLMRSIFSEVQEKNGRREHGRISDAMRNLLEQKIEDGWIGEKLENYTRVAHTMADCCNEIQKLLEQSLVIVKDIEDIVSTDESTRIDLMITVNEIMLEINILLEEFQKIGTILNGKGGAEIKVLNKVLKKGGGKNKSPYLAKLNSLIQEIVDESKKQMQRSLTEYMALLNTYETFGKMLEKLIQKNDGYEPKWMQIQSAIQAKIKTMF